MKNIAIVAVLFLPIICTATKSTIASYNNECATFSDCILSNGVCADAAGLPTSAPRRCMCADGMIHDTRFSRCDRPQSTANTSALSPTAPRTISRLFPVYVEEHDPETTPASALIEPRLKLPDTWTCSNDSFYCYTTWTPPDRQTTQNNVLVAVFSPHAEKIAADAGTTLIPYSDVNWLCKNRTHTQATLVTHIGSTDPSVYFGGRPAGDHCVDCATWCGPNGVCSSSGGLVPFKCTCQIGWVGPRCSVPTFSKLQSTPYKHTSYSLAVDYQVSRPCNFTTGTGCLLNEACYIRMGAARPFATTVSRDTLAGLAACWCTKGNVPAGASGCQGGPDLSNGAYIVKGATLAGRPLHALDATVMNPFDPTIVYARDSSSTSPVDYAFINPAPPVASDPTAQLQTFMIAYWWRCANPSAFFLDTRKANLAAADARESAHCMGCEGVCGGQTRANCSAPGADPLTGTCVCTANWAGSHCDRCANEKAGPFCDQTPTQCAAERCSGIEQGACVTDQGGARVRCACQRGFYGDRCQYARAACSTEFCTSTQSRAIPGRLLAPASCVDASSSQSSLFAVGTAPKCTCEVRGASVGPAIDNPGLRVYFSEGFDSAAERGCTMNATVCASQRCANRGTCANNQQSCTCLPWYSRYANCTAGLCLNGGIALPPLLPDGSPLSCNCSVSETTRQWHGEFCQYPYCNFPFGQRLPGSDECRCRESDTVYRKDPATGNCTLHVCGLNGRPSFTGKDCTCRDGYTDKHIYSTSPHGRCVPVCARGGGELRIDQSGSRCVCYPGSTGEFCQLPFHSRFGKTGAGGVALIATFAVVTFLTLSTVAWLGWTSGFEWRTRLPHARAGYRQVRQRSD